MDFTKDSTTAIRLKKAVMTTCALASLVLGATAANADESQFTVAVIQDAAHGRTILAEDYQSAIDALQTVDAEGLEAFYVANNLCVAYLKTGELAKAKQSCDDAVLAIEAVLEARGTGTSLHAGSLAQRRSFLAVALTNRGVVRASDGESDMARADFRAAIEVRSRTERPETNLAHLTQLASLGE